MVWFKVDDTLAFHHKVVAAGNAAMGMWVRAGSWSSQNLTDGFVPDHMVTALGSIGQAKKLVAVRLWTREPGGYRFWQWTEPGRQPTRGQIEEDRAAARERMRRVRGGRGSGEVRPNVRPNTGVGHDTLTTPVREESGASHGDDGEKTSALPDAEHEPDNDDTPQVNASRSGEHSGEQNPNEQRTSPPVRQPRPVPSRPEGSVQVDRSSSGSRAAHENDDDHEDLDTRIVTLVAQLTGRHITPEWATRIRRQILDGRTIRDPAAYVTRAIRESPNDFVPHNDPADQPPPPQGRRDPNTTERGAAAVRAALTRRPT